ncbi:MAG: hypothetical protein MMC33_007633 [Icmadophila ericetorum]|nr:hypothetical protein [Icmadophila ericetorum]
MFKWVSNLLATVTTLMSLKTTVEPESPGVVAEPEPSQTSKLGSSKLDTLLSCCLHDPKQEDLIYIPRFKHRLTLTKAWSIKPNQKILDIGCGQGESCLAVALDLGPSGHVIGIDTAEPDYGTPFSIQKSQDFVTKSILGERISFMQTDTVSLLEKPDYPRFDAATLCHSLWYFSTRESVIALFQSLATARISRIYLAEYSFRASEPSQIPHVLACQALALFNLYKTPAPTTDHDSHPYNVRAAPDQAAILAAAKKAGFEVRRQGVILPDVSMLEGHFEARHIKGERFRARVQEEKFPKEQEEQILAFQPRVREEMEKLEREGIPTVRAMDVWWAELELELGN